MKMNIKILLCISLIGFGKNIVAADAEFSEDANFFIMQAPSEIWGLITSESDTDINEYYSPYRLISPIRTSDIVRDTINDEHASRMLLTFEEIAEFPSFVSKDPEVDAGFRSDSLPVDLCSSVTPEVDFLPEESSVEPACRSVYIAKNNQCDQCGQHFSRKDMLNRHMLNSHFRIPYLNESRGMPGVHDDRASIALAELTAARDRSERSSCKQTHLSPPKLSALLVQFGIQHQDIVRSEMNKRQRRG